MCLGQDIRRWSPLSWAYYRLDGSLASELQADVTGLDVGCIFVEILISACWQLDAPERQQPAASSTTHCHDADTRQLPLTPKFESSRFS